MCAVGESTGDYLSVHSWTGVEHRENIVCFPCRPCRLSVTWWLLSGDGVRGKGRDEDNEGEVCEGHLDQVSQGITRGPLEAPTPPLALHISNRGYFLSTSIMLKVQILLPRAIRVWHPGALTLGAGGWGGGGGGGG